MVRAEHALCGHETRVRLPASLPAQRSAAWSAKGAHSATTRRRCTRLISWVGARPVPPARAGGPCACDRAGRRGEDAAVEPLLAPVAATHLPPLPALGTTPAAPASPTVPAWVRDPRSRGWRCLSVPLGIAAVIAGLAADPGRLGQSPRPRFAAPRRRAPRSRRPERRATAARADAPAARASLVGESSFSLALPAGWQRTSTTAGGATFAAAAADGDADATLWVERTRTSTSPTSRLARWSSSKSLAGSARVVERVAAPTAEGTIVRLAADAPEGSPAYEVTLRVSGPYRYYLCDHRAARRLQPRP